MPIENGFIKSPVSIEDVRQALGVSTRDLGSLCTSNKVNIWCKNKPVKYPSISETDRTKLGEGIRISNLEDSPENIALAPEGYVWTWDKPTGGIGSPFRLTDFQGYNVNCLCPATIETFAKVYGDNSSVAEFSIWGDTELPTSNLSATGVFSKSDSIGNYIYGDYRVTLAITDAEATKVICYFFAERPLKFNTFGFESWDKREVAVWGKQLKEKYLLTDGSTYRAVMLLTNYPGSNFDSVDFDMDLKYGITAEEMKTSRAKGVALELKQGISQFTFTYHKSELSGNIVASKFLIEMTFDRQINIGHTYNANVYQLYNFVFYANYFLAHFLATGGQWKLEYRIITYHQPVDYINKIVKSGNYVYNKSYTIIDWHEGTDLVPLDEVPYEQNTPEFRYRIDISYLLPSININGTDTDYAPILFDSSDETHEVDIRFMIRKGYDTSTAIVACSDYASMDSEQDYYYFDESVIH